MLVHALCCFFFLVYPFEYPTVSDFSDSCIVCQRHRVPCFCSAVNVSRGYTLIVILLLAEKEQRRELW